jgi:hypothetical protein
MFQFIKNIISKTNKKFTFNCSVKLISYKSIFIISSIILLLNSPFINIFSENYLLNFVIAEDTIKNKLNIVNILMKNYFIYDSAEVLFDSSSTLLIIYKIIEFVNSKINININIMKTYYKKIKFIQFVLLIILFYSTKKTRSHY